MKDDRLREDRLAAALRANLSRRKARARGELPPGEAEHQFEASALPIAEASTLLPGSTADG